MILSFPVALIATLFSNTYAKQTEEPGAVTPVSSLSSLDAIPSSSTASSTTSSALPRQGVDFIGPLWLPRTFKITCCRGGEPQAESDLLIRNWTQTKSDFAVDGRAEEACNVYEGSFLLAATALFNLKTFTGFGVKCNCKVVHEETGSPIGLDQHCRALPPCQNNGYRSFSLNMRCACPEPFFGELCDKKCEQGQKLKSNDGREYCSCVPFYQGEECKEMVCLNGGVETRGRCTCPSTFLGYHCEIDTNRSVSALGSTRYQKYGENNDLFSRDISGTIFSLVMIVVLVVSMYLLMKHRIQGRSSRREETVIRSIYGLPRRGDTISPEAATRTIPFSAMGIEGPPPYVSARGRIHAEMLPPLPSYDDATKLQPLNCLRNSRVQAASHRNSVNVTVAAPPEDHPSSSTSHGPRIPPTTTDVPSEVAFATEQAPATALARNPIRRSI